MVGVREKVNGHGFDRLKRLRSRHFLGSVSSQSGGSHLALSSVAFVLLTRFLERRRAKLYCVCH